MYESIKYSDYWSGVCAMHVLGVATTHTFGSKSYCNGEFDSNLEINAEHPLFLGLGAWNKLLMEYK